VGGLVVVNGVRPPLGLPHEPQNGPGRLLPAWGGRVAPGAVALAAGLLLRSLAGLLAFTLALAVGGLLAGIRAEARLRPGSSGWPKRCPQVGQVR
jgi:hypothetical protein